MKPGVTRLSVLMAALSFATVVQAQETTRITPVLSIWDVRIGQPVADIPASAVAEIDCGTNGGPSSLSLARFADFATCPAEPSGLHEVAFTYDDEQDYIARALELEYQVLRGGTSVFANPVVVSILVHPDGVARGIRIVTDDRVSARDRINAVTLARNFKARYSEWNLSCVDLPPRDGEQPVGNQFIHEICTGDDPAATGMRLMIEASYLRKRGQEAMSRETQTVNTGYFESRTHFELVDSAFARAAP